MKHSWNTRETKCNTLQHFATLCNKPANACFTLKVYKCEFCNVCNTLQRFFRSFFQTRLNPLPTTTIGAKGFLCIIKRKSPIYDDFLFNFLANVRIFSYLCIEIGRYVLLCKKKYQILLGNGFRCWACELFFSLGAIHVNCTVQPLSRGIVILDRAACVDLPISCNVSHALYAAYIKSFFVFIISIWIW